MGAAMNRLRGWCECGGPLWREDECRVCRLTVTYPKLFWPPIPWTRADANSTENTAATSTWLPVGARDFDVRRAIGWGLVDFGYLQHWLVEPWPN